MASLEEDLVVHKVGCMIGFIINCWLYRVAEWIKGGKRDKIVFIPKRSDYSCYCLCVDGMCVCVCVSDCVTV